MAVKYSVVVPCFNEEETVGAFYNAVVPVMDQTKEKYELIFINDGSRDKTEEILKSLAEKDKKVKVINFSRKPNLQTKVYGRFIQSFRTFAPIICCTNKTLLS